MSVEPIARPCELLVVTKGHPFDRAAFFAMLDAVSMRGIVVTHVEQPAAVAVLRPESAPDYDAVLFYDMSGIAIPAPGAAAADPLPPADYVSGIESLLERGTGIVLMNHGLLSWPAWPLWRALSNTSFLLREGEVHGERLPGSGYRGGMGQPDRNAATKLLPALADHPVLDGLEQGLEVQDELYLKSPCFEERVLPLLRSDYSFRAEHFSPPPLAAPDEQAAWSHPPGSDLVVWANACGQSPVVACEIGDGPVTYANPGFQRLIGNAILWVASPEARAWAAIQTPSRS
jgi:hypothetical protein